MKLVRRPNQTQLLRRAIPYINKAKRVSFPGFDKVPIYNVAIFFFRGIKNGAINQRASAVAYSLVLALFPAIIFLFTLIPIMPIENFQEELLLLIQSVLPISIYDTVEKFITDIITIKHSGVLSVGFALALIFSTNGINALIQSFNASVNVEDTRSWIMQRFVALLLTFSLVILVTISISLITVSQDLLNFLVNKGLMRQNWTYYLVIFGKWIIIVGVFFIAYSSLYYFGPDRKSKFRFISAGGTLATLLSIAISSGFGFYIDNFARYNALYGSLGALPVVMIMIYLNCFAIILGFELNIGIVAARKIHLEAQNNNPFHRKK